MNEWIDGWMDGWREHQSPDSFNEVPDEIRHY